jgi:hypothetical protein
MKTFLVSLILLAACLALPASAAPLDKCTDVTPVLEFDAVGCAGQVVDLVPECPQLGCAYEVENLVVDPLCPYERLVFDDVIGGPLAGNPCIHGSPPG